MTTCYLLLLANHTSKLLAVNLQFIPVCIQWIQFYRRRKFLCVGTHPRVILCTEWTRKRNVNFLLLVRTRLIAFQLTYFLEIWQHTMRHRQPLNYFEPRLIWVNWIARAVHPGDCWVRNNLKCEKFSKKRRKTKAHTENWNYFNDSQCSCTNSRQSFLFYCSVLFRFVFLPFLLLFASVQ